MTEAAAGSALPRQREATRTQIRGSSLLLAGRFVSLGANFVIQVLIVRYLTKADYGAFAYALAIVGMGESVAILGLDRAVGRFVPMYDEGGDRGRVLATLILVAGTIVSLGLAFVLVVFGLQGALSGAVVSDEKALSLLLILIVLAPIQALDHLTVQVFAIYSNARAIFFRKHVVAPALKLAVVLLLVLSGSGVSFLAAGYVVAGALGVAVYGTLLVRTLRQREILRRIERRRVLEPARELFGFALPLLAVDLLFVLMNTTDALLLERYHGTEAVGELRAVRPSAHLNMLVMSSFVLLFTPLASRLLAREDRDGVRDLYWQTATWIAVLTFPVFALTFSLAEPFTVTLFGERYREAALFLSILAAGYYFNAALGFNGLTLRVFGRVRYVVWISVAAAVFNLGANFALIPAHGALGAAIATCLTLVFHNVLKQAGLRRGTGIPVFEARYLLVYASIALAAGGLLVVQAAASPGIVPSLALACAASAAVLAITRRRLHLAETFPELVKFRFLRWLAG